MANEKIIFFQNLNIFISEHDLSLIENCISKENPCNELENFILSRISPLYRNYYQNKIQIPVNIMNIITKEINTTNNGLMMLFFTFLYHKFSKTFLKDSIQKRHIYTTILKSQTKIIKTDFFEENQKIIEDIESFISRNNNELSDLRSEIEKLNNCKIISEENELLKITIGDKMREINKLNNELKLKQDKVECLCIENEKLKNNMINDLVEASKENIVYDGLDEFKTKISEIETKIENMEKEKKILIDDIKKLESIKTLNHHETFVLKKILYKERKYKIYLETVKEHVKESKITNKRFFSIQMTNSVLNKIKKKMGYSEMDFSYFLKIDQKDKNIPKSIKKILLKTLCIITKGTSSKASVWFRNYHTDHKNKKDIYEKFYHTYINPFDEKDEITYDEYKNLSTKNKRKLFIIAYKKFDEETKNMISLYDGDNKERGKRFIIDNTVNTFEIVKSKIMKKRDKKIEEIESIQISIDKMNERKKYKEKEIQNEKNKKNKNKYKFNIVVDENPDHDFIVK